MKPKELLNADYLDIVFDQRNKRYGGYELRKHYDQRIGKATMLALTGVAVMLSFSFISVSHEKDVKPNDTPVVITEYKIPPVEKKPEVQPPKPPAAPPKPITTVRSTVIVVEPDDLVKPDDTPPLNNKIGDAVVGTQDHSGEPAGIASDISGPKGGTSTSVITDNKPAPIPTWVEQMPAFNGDMNAYLNKNLHYPDMARENGIEGKVIIRFIVNEDGSVSDVTVVRSVGGGCDAEAVRIVSGMPKWKPGKQNGKEVKVIFNLPIVFKLY